MNPLPTSASGVAISRLCVVAALVMSCSGPAVEAPAAGGEPEPVTADSPIVAARHTATRLEPTTVATLDNGLQVITLVDDSAPLVSVQLWYHVGARNEQPDRRGFAHLFEHMMFRGTPRLGPAEHMELLQATGGDANAWTGFDETVYTQEVPAEQLELVLWLESERMSALRIDAEGFVKERDVVAEEYRVRAEQPYGTVGERVLPAVFGEGGTYSWLPIGDLDELGAATLDEIRAFWLQHYVPNNATLVIVGDVDPARVAELTERYFGWIPRGEPTPPLATTVMPRDDSPRTVEIDARNGPAPLVGLGWRTVAAGHEDEVALDVLASILGGDPSSRLYKRLVVDEDAAMYALAASLVLESDGVFGAGAVLSPLFSDKQAVLAVLREEIERMRTEGPTDDELTKARNQALRAAVAGQTTADAKATALGRAAVIYGDVARAADVLAEIEAVTADDVRRVANTWLAPEHEIELRIEPSLLGFLTGGAGEDAPDAPASGDDPEPPAPNAPETATWGKPGLTRPADLPESPPVAAPAALDWETPLHETTLSNGLRVVAVPDHEVPWVTITLGVLYGATSDPAGAPGTASVAASMLERGTASHPYDVLTETLGREAISLGASASLDSTRVSASSVTTQAPLAMELMASAVREPAFDAEQFELLIDQLRTARVIAEASPSFVADRELRRRLYGAGGHPYARQATPSVAELDALTRQGLASWWSSHVRPDTSVLYIAGDLAPAEAFALAESGFGDWQAAGAAPPAVEAPAIESPATTIYLIDRNVEQSQIRVASPSIGRHDPDWYASRVLSHIFGGGGLSSWLNRRIRGDEGLTYGAYGGIGARRLGGEFSVSTFSKVTSTVDTLRIILEEIARLRTDAPTADELERARGYLIGSFVLSHETPGAMVGERWLIDSQSLPDDYIEQLLEGVRTTRAEDLPALARRHIDPARLTIVVLGPADVLREPLEALAPVVVVDP